MPTVKVLIPGVGSWDEGEVVKDAPPGLVEMARKETVNAATRKRVAVLVEDEDEDDDELKELKQRAKELNVRGYGNMGVERLRAAVEAAEELAKQQQGGGSAGTDPQAGAGGASGDGTNPDQ